MKTLIVEKIKPNGMPTPVNITIFNTNDPTTSRYFNIGRLSGRILSVEYAYEENGKETGETLLIPIPKGLDESGVKQHIIDQINNVL